MRKIRALHFLLKITVCCVRMENKLPSSRDPETKIVTGHPAFSPGFRLALFYATTFFVIGIYMPFWPAWLSNNGLGPTEIGILLSITTWTRVVMAPLVAQAADRLGRRKPFMIGLGFMTLVTFFLFTYSSFVLKAIKAYATQYKSVFYDIKLT